MMPFLNPLALDALIPKFHSHFLPYFGSGSPPGPEGQSRQGFGGPIN